MPIDSPAAVSLAGRERRGVFTGSTPPLNAGNCQVAMASVSTDAERGAEMKYQDSRFGSADSTIQASARSTAPSSWKVATTRVADSQRSSSVAKSVHPGRASEPRSVATKNCRIGATVPLDADNATSLRLKPITRSRPTDPTAPSAPLRSGRRTNRQRRRRHSR